MVGKHEDMKLYTSPIIVLAMALITLLNFAKTLGEYFLYWYAFAIQSIYHILVLKWETEWTFPWSKFPNDNFICRHAQIIKRSSKNVGQSRVKEVQSQLDRMRARTF